MVSAGEHRLPITGFADKGHSEAVGRGSRPDAREVGRQVMYSQGTMALIRVEKAQGLQKERAFSLVESPRVSKGRQKRVGEVESFVCIADRQSATSCSGSGVVRYHPGECGYVERPLVPAPAALGASEYVPTRLRGQSSPLVEERSRLRQLPRRIESLPPAAVPDGPPRAWSVSPSGPSAPAWSTFS